MKRTLSIALVVSVAGIACTAATIYSYYNYVLYRTASRNYQAAINTYEDQLKGHLAKLEAEINTLRQPRSHFRSRRMRAFISTTDHPPYHLFEGITNRGTYIGYLGKGNFIGPELRIDPSTNYQRREFPISINPDIGQVLDAWVTPPGAASGVAGVSDIYVSSIANTNTVMLTVELKPVGGRIPVST